jgi:transforming growth factor-beta-induced protein
MVFAPTDEAFAKLPKGTVEDLLKPENRERLVATLTYHVVPGKIMVSDVVTNDAKTVNGKKLPIKLDAGKAKVGKADIPASNGAFHVVDSVLIP